MFAIMMAFLGPMLQSGGNLLDSYFANYVIKSKSAIVFYNSLTNFIAIPFLLMFGTPQFLSWEIFPFVLLIAGVETFHLLPYYWALRKIDTSIASATVSLGNIFLPILAWFWVDERLEVSQYIGFAIVILFSIILNVKSIHHITINSALGFMAIVSIMLMFQAVCFKYVIGKTDWVTAVFYNLLFSTIMSFCFFLFPVSRQNIRQSFPFYKKSVHYFLLNELIFQTGELPARFALSILPVVAIEGIKATQPIFVLLLGFLLHRFLGAHLKENFQPQNITKKLICFVFIVLGVILILK